MGDAGISSSSLQTFFDAFGFHANFLRLLVDNQGKGCTDQPTTTIYHACAAPSNAGGMGSAAWFNGSVPDVTPFSTGPYGANPGSTDWQTAFPVVARNLLLHYGPVLSKPVLTEIWPSLELFMAYLERLITHSTQGSRLLLLDGARGDWIPPEGNMGGPYPTPTKPISAFWHTLCVGYMAEIATAIGKRHARSFPSRWEFVGPVRLTSRPLLVWRRTHGRREPLLGAPRGQPQSLPQGSSTIMHN